MGDLAQTLIRKPATAMRVADAALDDLVRAAGTLGLDGSDRGAVRRFVWAEVGSDAVDHDVVDAVAERLARRRGCGTGVGSPI